MSETDALTGLYNRRAAEDHISRQMQEDGKNPDCVRPLISIDLDKFKQVNDTYGHLEGDALLIAVADTLRTSVRSYDIVGRIGGDEFVVYLSNVTDRQNAMAVAEKLCQVIRGLSTMKKNGAIFLRALESHLPIIQILRWKNSIFRLIKLCTPPKETEETSIRPSDVPAGCHCGILTLHRYCSPFPHKSSSFICPSYSSSGRNSFKIWIR